VAIALAQQGMRRRESLGSPTVNGSDSVSGNLGQFAWHSAARSHVGTVRKVNEDSCLERPEIGLWVVADGMGGHHAGDLASQTVVASLRSLAAPTSRESLLFDLQQNLQTVNDHLQRLAAESPERGIIGTTVAILVGYHRQAICVWVGDSRIYLCRGRQLRQLTRDHSQVEELIKLGLLDRDEAESHPASNVITRAVGAAGELKIDMVSGELHEQDIYLLCSDGLNKVVPDVEIGEILQTQGCDEAAGSLIDRALDYGARDNVTAVVVHKDVREYG
jgi:protein phosphatase